MLKSIVNRKQPLSNANRLEIADLPTEQKRLGDKELSMEQLKQVSGGRMATSCTSCCDRPDCD